MNESGDLKYQFNDSLDQAFLEQMYGGDLSYTVQLFEIFLSQTLLEVEQLRSAVKEEDGKRTFQLAHKIKPTFGMVGLTTTKEILRKIEVYADNPSNFLEIKSLIVEMNDHMKTYIPILEAEVKNMQKYIEKI